MLALQAADEEFVVVKLVSHEGGVGSYEFEVLWEPCDDNNYRTDETTWQTEEVLIEDGLKHKIVQYWADKKAQVLDKDRNHHKPPVEELKQPEALTNVEMREYQLEGLKWLVSMYDHGVPAILADEMGLGKTLQTIAFLAHLKFERNVHGPHLVVCPLSVLATWTSEFKRFCPEMKVLKLHSSNHEERARSMSAMNKNLSQIDVVVTTYEMIRKSGSTAFSKVWFRYVILDEGHLIKNELTLSHKCTTGLHSQGKLLLTGTPLQNNLHELWSLLHYLYPAFFPNSAKFDDCFDLNGKDSSVNNAMLLQANKLLQPLMLRRLKAEVEKGLPPKLETKILCDLSPMQSIWYKRILLKDLSLLEGAMGGGKGVREGGGGKAQKLQNLLMQLRKCCNHPYMFQGADPAPGSITEDLVTNSGKLQILDRLLTKLKLAGNRVVLFSQFTATLDILEDFLVPLLPFASLCLPFPSPRPSAFLPLPCLPFPCPCP